MRSLRLHLVSAWIIVQILVFQVVDTAFAQQANSNRLVSRADSMLSEGQSSEARRIFEDALKIDGGNTAALLGLSRVDMYERAWPKAKNRLDGILDEHPDLIGARYLRAITLREIAKFRTFNQDQYWAESRADFEFAIARDSSYKDVLYQYALWHRYQEFFEPAIELGHQQLRQKPDSSELVFGLFKLYEYFVRHAQSPEKLAWLRQRKSPYDRYFEGEMLRREGELDGADDIFRNLINSNAPIALQPVLLSRARIQFARNSERLAQTYVQQAIESIQNSLHARLVLEDFKYLLTDEELDLFHTLHTPEEFQSFFAAFWARRDPTPARPVNVRMTEHYRRLLIAEKEYSFDGFRLWHNDPDRLGALKFPASYDLNEEFNDKGLIFIRHGEPYDREIQVGGDLEFRSVIDNTSPFGAPVEYSTSQGWRPNESWRYTTPRPMDFHFILAEGGPNAWRLIPELTNIDMLASREHWGPIYYEMAEAARAMSSIRDAAMGSRGNDNVTSSALDEQAQLEFATSGDTMLSTVSYSRRSNLGYVDQNSRQFLEFTTLQRRMEEESAASIELGLSSDQHTWAEEIEAIPMPYQIATFRGDSSRTRVDVYFALPIGQITNKMDQNVSSIEVEMGYAVHDTNWLEVIRQAEAKRLPAHEEESAAVIDFFTFSVPADSYNVSIFSNPFQTDQQSGFKFPYRIPDYTQNRFSMSDLLLANYIGPAQSDSRFDRGALHISPNPFHRYATSQSVFVYFELYNLTFDTTDLAKFTIEYVLTTSQEKRGLFKKKDRPLLTLRVDRTSDSISPVEYAEIDVSKVDPGNYELTVRVTDVTSGEIREQSRTLELFR